MFHNPSAFAAEDLTSSNFCWSTDFIGVLEFALIKGLEFVTPLEEANIDAHYGSNNIIEKYFKSN